MDNKILKVAEKEISKKIDIKKSIEENHFDSLDLMTLLAICEDFYKIRFNDNNYN